MSQIRPQPTSQPACELLPMERVIPRPSLHYTHENGGSMQELAESIRQEGLHRPLIVQRTERGRYRVVSGNRRLMACRMLGMAQIPVRVLPDSMEGMPKEQLLEALETSEMHYLEEAEILMALSGRHGVQIREMAKCLGRHPQMVTDQMRLSNYEPELRAFLLEEGVPLEIAFTLLPLPAGRRMAVLRRIAREQLCVRDAALLVAAALRRQPVVQEPPAPMPETPVVAAKKPRKPTGRVINMVRDHRIYLNAFRDIAGQMRDAGLNANLIERRIGCRVEVTISLSTRRRRAARYQST